MRAAARRGLALLRSTEEDGKGAWLKTTSDRGANSRIFGSRAVDESARIRGRSRSRQKEGPYSQLSVSKRLDCTGRRSGVFGRSRVEGLRHAARMAESGIHGYRELGR